MLRVALALLTGTATSLPPPPSCSHLQHAYGARGVPREAVPKTPVSGEFCFFSRVQQCRGRVSLVRQIGFFLSVFWKSKRRRGSGSEMRARNLSHLSSMSDPPPLPHCCTRVPPDIKVSGGDLNLIPKHASPHHSRLSLGLLTQSLAQPFNISNHTVEVEKW